MWLINFEPFTNPEWSLQFYNRITQKPILSQFNSIQPTFVRYVLISSFNLQLGLQGVFSSDFRINILRNILQMFSLLVSQEGLYSMETIITV